MTTYAQFEVRTARLATDFGYDLAVKWFGQEAVDALPKFVKGKNAGKPKATLMWKKVTRGGWVRKERATANGDATGYVERRVGQVIGKKLVLIEWGASSPSEVYQSAGDDFETY